MLDAAGEPVRERALVREVASIVVMCELAEELSGGGQLDELRSRLAQLRMTEQPAGIEDGRGRPRSTWSARSARRPASPRPRSSTTSARRRSRWSRALGELESPFASALRSSTGAMDGFLAEVETRYLLPLS